MAHACAAVAAAASAGARLVVLPENYSGIASPARRRAWAFDPEHPDDAAAIAPLRALADAHDLVIVAGGTPEHAPASRLYNTAAVITSKGVVARYRKLHLFDADVPGQPPLRESHEVAPGDRAVACVLPEAVVGLSICYDLRFAELYRALTVAGAEVLVVPAAFTHPTGQAHWEVLVRARAIETQCFVLAAAQAGEHGAGRRSWGHSMIVDPWGRVLAEAGDDDAMVVADLEPEVLVEARARIPCADHRVAADRLAVARIDIGARGPL
jgi:predicted amidohydrolase